MNPGGRKLQPGKLTILALFAVGIAAALAGWWQLREQSRRAIGFWGPAHARRIARAPHVELLVLSPAAADEAGVHRPAEEEEILSNGEGAWRVVRRIDLSEARGLANLRRALVSDASFAWEKPVPEEPGWDYALRFDDGLTATTVLVALDEAAVRRVGSGPAVSVAPIAEGLGRLVQEQREAGSGEGERLEAGR